MRKVYLDKLPKRGKNIDWKKSVGHNIRFEYDDIVGEFEIIDYDKNTYKVKLLYNDNEHVTRIDNLSLCKISIILGLYSFNKDYKYCVGSILTTKSGTIKILEQVKMKDSQHFNFKGYLYECHTCNYHGEISEYDIKDNIGCPVCCKFSQKVLKGFNDMWTTNPELAKLLANPDDGYKYTQSSSKRVDWKCPNCNVIIKNKQINQIKSRNLSCNWCLSGLSYPEKFVSKLLSQLNINFEYQYSPKWIKPKRYDFYLCDINGIIEINGIQHYEGSFAGLGGKTLKEEQMTDEIKKTTAKNNGINTYIVIDARKSNLEWIKNNILNSELNYIFDLYKVDWNDCHKYACEGSFIKNICELWNENLTVREISKKLQINKTTVVKYLKYGAYINLCDYSPIKSRAHNKKKVVQLDKELNYLYLYESIISASNKLKISSNTILNVCKRKIHCKTAGGFKWMYLDDYNKMIESQTQLVQLS